MRRTEASKLDTESKKPDCRVSMSANAGQQVLRTTAGLGEEPWLTRGNESEGGKMT